MSIDPLFSMSNSHFSAEILDPICPKLTKKSKKILRKNYDKKYKLYQAIQRYFASKFLPKFCSYFL